MRLLFPTVTKAFTGPSNMRTPPELSHSPRIDGDISRWRLGFKLNYNGERPSMHTVSTFIVADALPLARSSNSYHILAPASPLANLNKAASEF